MSYYVMGSFQILTFSSFCLLCTCVFAHVSMNCCTYFPQLVKADGCPSLSLVLPVKMEFFLPTVAKCLLIGGGLIIGVFSVLLLGLLTI